jgi:4,5-DOPA dioxygenase extradiol
MTRMPVLFLGHGSPMNAIETNAHTEAWSRMGRSVPRPRAILAISAHWFIPDTRVTAMERPRTIHDFGNFPRALFEVEYPAPGDPALAMRVRDLLHPAEVGLDARWGLDHGTWSVLVHVFPGADIPVVQLSIDMTKSPEQQYERAGLLAPLRDEGVLIVASGNVAHNLETIRFGEPEAPGYDWAVRFNATMRRALTERDHSAVVNYQQGGRDAALAAPDPDHFYPLIYAIGLQGPQDMLTIETDGIELGSIGMLSATIGGA